MADVTTANRRTTPRGVLQSGEPILMYLVAQKGPRTAPSNSRVIPREPKVREDRARGRVFFCRIIYSHFIAAVSPRIRVLLFILLCVSVCFFILACRGNRSSECRSAVNPPTKVWDRNSGIELPIGVTAPLTAAWECRRFY